jgi:hypothetical protein
MKTYIYVSTDFTGFHCWPEAPDSVAFLRQIHRHKFGVMVTAQVTHNDRQLEFFTLQGEVKASVTRLMLLLRKNSSYSCEMMAEHIGKELTELGILIKSVEVNEDRENGAFVTFFEDNEKENEKPNV